MAKCLCVNDLENRLTVEKNTPEASTDGQMVESWKSVFPVYAKVTARGGMERRIFEQLRAECDYVVQFMQSEKTRQIKPADYRLDYGGKKLNIAAIFDPDGKRWQFDCHCTEVIV